MEPVEWVVLGIVGLATVAGIFGEPNTDQSSVLDQTLAPSTSTITKVAILAGVVLGGIYLGKKILK